MKSLSSLVPFVTAHTSLNFLRKVYQKYQKLSNYLSYGDPNFPRIISLEVSTFCNRKCSYCPNSFRETSKIYIKQEVLNNFCARLKELKWGGVVDFIFFNEPLLHPHLSSIVRQVKEAAPRCLPRISSNGDALSEQKMRDLISAGIVRFYIMRHTPSSFEWIIRINKLRELFPGYIVLMDINEISSQDGLHNFGGFIPVPKIRRWPRVSGKKICTVHEHQCQTDINGDWVLCCVDYQKSTRFGNLKDKSFLEIWKSFKGVRENLRAGLFDHHCYQCVNSCL